PRNKVRPSKIRDVFLTAGCDRDRSRTDATVRATDDHSPHSFHTPHRRPLVHRGIMKSMATKQAPSAAPAPTMSDKLYMENTLLRVAGALFCHDAKRAPTHTK